IYVNGANNTLTLDAASTGTGQIQIYSDSSNGTAVTNQGTITHTSGSGYLYARNLSNSGNITASAGTLQIGSTAGGFATTNSGTITANGGTANIDLDGDFANTGTLSAQNSGQLFFRGVNTTANLGTVQLSTGGHAYLNGTLTNTAATLTAPTGGIFELYSGTIVGGTVASGALTFTNGSGTHNGVTLNGNFSSPASTGVNF